MQYIDPTYCAWDTTSTLLLFSDNVFGNFIYYSHLLPIACLLLLSVALLWQDHKNNATRALFFMALMFTAWSLSDLVLWATANPTHTMFFWSNIIHFEVLFYIGALYFIYYFISNAGPSWKQELLLAILYLPLILFVHTSLNLTGFDYTNCWREALEGPLVTYAYALELCIALWILGYGLWQAHKRHSENRTAEILFGTIGTTLVLVSFSLGNIIGTLEIDWELGQYGLFGLPVFVGLLTFLIVRYNSFDAKLFSAQALIAGIFLLVISILFVRRIENIQIITSITAVLILVLGYLLVKSVHREIEQRQKLEELAKKLAGANKRLKVLDQLKSEFVSIASHQLRSPLTSIRGYTSMLLEGSFGKLPAKAAEAVARINESSRYMAVSVEDYLNVSRIQSGNMKYELSEFDLKQLAKSIAEDMRPEGVKKGILISFRATTDSKCMVKADIGKTRQIIQNLLDNALKYTKTGSITVFVHDKKRPNTVFIDITDTGIGMSGETLANIFGKFERARNANDVNVTGTGLGLYVARKMAEDMQGTVTARSEGEGKGSTFTLELPYIC